MSRGGRIKELVPVGWRAWLRRHFGWRWFHGDYPDWSAACRDAAGYHEEAILRRVIAAARDVRSGRAVWDRDGTTFAEAWHHRPLVDALRAAAAQRGHRLVVVDFGGALGSTWWQHREVLADVVSEWRVIEQPAWSQAGRREFADDVLSFHPSLAEAMRLPSEADVILLSSVLPYLPEPYVLIDEIIRWRIPEIIVDRTPFTGAGPDRIVVQKTPPALGGGSYACRLFGRESVKTALVPEYRLVAEWEVSFDLVDETVDYRGLHFRLIEALKEPQA